MKLPRLWSKSNAEDPQPAQVINQAILRKTGDPHQARGEVVEAIIMDLIAARWLPDDIKLN